MHIQMSLVYPPPFFYMYLLMCYSREMSTIPQTTTGLREGGGLKTWVLPQREAGLSI